MYNFVCGKKSLILFFWKISLSLCVTEKRRERAFPFFTNFTNNFSIQVNIPRSMFICIHIHILEKQESKREGLLATMSHGTGFKRSPDILKIWLTVELSTLKRFFYSLSIPLHTSSSLPLSSAYHCSVMLTQLPHRECAANMYGELREKNISVIRVRCIGWQSTAANSATEIEMKNKINNTNRLQSESVCFLNRFVWYITRCSV